MITEDYVSFETAKLLKEKGFNWPCHATYDTAVTGGKPKFSEYEVLNFFPFGIKNSDDKFSMVISAPTLQMAVKWLREVHNIFISIAFCIYPTEKRVTWTPEITTFESVFPESAIEYDSSERAAEEAIKYCLENLI